MCSFDYNSVSDRFQPGNEQLDTEMDLRILNSATLIGCAWNGSRTKNVDHFKMAIHQKKKTFQQRIL